jgi:hypothetical protein
MIMHARFSPLFTRLTQPVRIALFLALSAVLAVLVDVGCASSEKQSKPTDIFAEKQFEGWQFYTYENVKIFYPPNHPQESSFPEVAKGYVKAMNQVSGALGIPVPTDTLYVIYYTGWGQGKEMTGHEYPYAENGIIHFWLPSFFGPTFVRWMLPKWVPEDPKYLFLKHGLISLFDYSGQDYDAATLRFVTHDTFISLDSLAVDTSVNSDVERVQSGEGASFVAFVLENFGNQVLKQMYQSRLPFDKFVEDTFRISVDSLQTLWLNYARNNVPDSAQG